MMIRTSCAPSEVTPARYLLPSAMSFSRRAATRGSTTPMRMPLLIAISLLPSGESSTESPGLTWASFFASGSSMRWAKPVRIFVEETGKTGFAHLIDEDADRRLAALLRRHGLLAGRDKE